MALPPAPRPDESPELRLSDSEREQAAAFLRHHMSEGRLTVVELEERLSVVYGARNRGDLIGLFDDLPSGAPSTTSRSGPPVRAPRDRQGLPHHVQVYLVFSAFFVLIWALTGAGYFWPIWPILGWGVPVALGCLNQRS